MTTIALIGLATAASALALLIVEILALRKALRVVDRGIRDALHRREK